MSAVSEHHGLLRTGLVGSLMLHLALALLPWGGLVGGEGEEPSGEASFEVSLIPGLAGGAEMPGEEAQPPVPTVEALTDPVEALSEPEPSEEPELVPEPAEPIRGVAPSVPGVSEGAATAPGDDGPAAQGEDSKGGSDAGLQSPPAPYSPPRLLAGALPIDPEDSEKLQVPSEIPVRLRVGEDGMVKEIVPSNPDLPPQVVEALERSAKAMKFIPARRGDRLVEAWFHMTFVYRN